MEERSSVKTAISIEKHLFEEIDALAGEMDVTRSRLLAIAAREFVNKHKSQKLLASINEAYEDQQDEAEVRLRQGMKTKQRARVVNEW